MDRKKKEWYIPGRFLRIWCVMVQGIALGV